MRPRFLLDLIGHCKSFAVNVGHQRLEVEDIEKGLKVFSSDLVMDIGFEISDVLGFSAERAGQVLMRFVGVDQILTEKEIGDIISRDVEAEHHGRLTKILLWHGVLGLSLADRR